MTGSASITFVGPHERITVPWEDFCAKIAALADRVPAERHPTVTMRYGTIMVTWDV